jgi:DNA-binding response OmpR family regulator
MPHLLLLENDADLRTALETHLKGEGFQVSTFGMGREALKFIAHPSLGARDGLDVAVLDLTLPDMDGLEVLRSIRQDPRTRNLRVLLVTGKNEDIDRVLSEDLWADDYVSKPLSSRELVARLRAILRRAAFLDQAQAQVPDQFAFGPISVDLKNHQAKVEGAAIDLTRREFELLAYFVKNPRRVHSREKILHEVWGLEFLGESRTIDAHVRRVRAKLGDAAGLIDTIVGIGYRMGSPENS